MNFCPSCGTQQQDQQARYCASCGNCLRAEQQPEPTAEPPSHTIKLHFQREKQTFLIDTGFDVILDGMAVASLQKGANVVFDVPAGWHSITVRQPLGFFPKNIHAPFTQDTMISVRLNRVTGGIDANVWPLTAPPSN